MIKGKSIFIISSILLASATVGTTFAIWSYNTNKPFDGENINPTVITTSNYETVSLSWGEKGTMQISELVPGKEQGPYHISLLATTSDSSKFIGSLSVSLVNSSTNEHKVIDYLNVAAYTSTYKTNKLLEIAPSDDKKEVNVNIEVSSATPKDIYFYFSLDDEATPYLGEITDELDVVVDWNISEDIDVLETNTIYYKNVDNWEHVYAYAFNSKGSVNKIWPGKEMSYDSSSEYFSIEIEEDMQFVIFNNGGSLKTDTLTIDPLNPYFNGTTWVAHP